MNEYLMLIRENLENLEKITAEEMQEDIERHTKWVDKLITNGNFKSGNPISPEGTHIKGSEKTLINRPYKENTEVVSGFYFLLANSLEEAAEIARSCPSIISGGTVEVREVIQT